MSRGFFSCIRAQFSAELFSFFLSQFHCPQPSVFFFPPTIKQVKKFRNLLFSIMQHLAAEDGSDKWSNLLLELEVKEIWFDLFLLNRTPMFPVFMLRWANWLQMQMQVQMFHCFQDPFKSQTNSGAILFVAATWSNFHPTQFPCVLR